MLQHRHRYWVIVLILSDLEQLQSKSNSFVRAWQTFSSRLVLLKWSFIIKSACVLYLLNKCILIFWTCQLGERSPVTQKSRCVLLTALHRVHLPLLMSDFVISGSNKRAQCCTLVRFSLILQSNSVRSHCNCNAVLDSHL